MAGGTGTRLWPYSRKNFPKQFLSLISEESFIQITAKRLALFTPPENIYVVSGQEYKFNVINHLSSALGDSFSNLILEPIGRNTAPAIALTVKYLIENCGVNDNEVLFFTPSDHLIHPAEQLKQAIERLMNRAQSQIITFGIVPRKPEVGYGYIELSEQEQDGVYRVNRFVEKPDASTAEKYLSAGNYLWNSGMFMFSVGVIMNAFKEHAPELYRMITQMEYSQVLNRYSEIKANSFDYAVMEKAKNILCCKMNLEWNDIGSWESVYELLPKDENGNAVLGNTETLDTRNSLIISDQHLTTVVGMEDVAVISTADAGLIIPRRSTQRVKQVVEQMRQKERPEVNEHRTTFRPWGSYTVLEEGPRFKIKRIVVQPGQKLSLQRHKHRSEHWVVIKGIAEVEIADKKLILRENESAYVPIYEKHRLFNPGKIPLEIIEVQNGEYVGEDDIERFHDIYDRE